MATGINKYSSQEALNSALNADRDAFAVDATVNVELDSDNDSVECIQDTPGDLKATVTQASIARTTTSTPATTSFTNTTGVGSLGVDVTSSSTVLYGLIINVSKADANEATIVGDSLLIRNDDSEVMRFIITSDVQTINWLPGIGVTFSNGLNLFSTSGSGNVSWNISSFYV